MSQKEHRLIDARVRLRVDEPYELVVELEGPLELVGRVSAIREESGIPFLVVQLADTDDRRIGESSTVNVAARHHGDELLNLSEGESLIVHGDFLSPGRLQRIGYIGLLTVLDSRT